MRLFREERPFLILTLRRTGGTALTGALSRASSFPGARHEPFNLRRDFGHVTEAYRADRDLVKLRKGMAEVLETRPNLKHCVETVPEQVTATLIDLAVELGYGMAVLTRRNEKARLRSLAIAQATQAWGPRQARRRYPEIQGEEGTPRSIDLRELTDAMLRDAANLGMTLRFLRGRQLPYSWWVFEEIYYGETSPADAAARLAREFGIRCRASDRAFEHLATSRSDSSVIEGYLSNLAEADALLNHYVPE